MNHATYRLAALLALSTLCASGSPQADGFFGIGPGFSDLSGSGVDNSAGGRAYAGFLFSEQYGIEVGYIDFGEYDVKDAPANTFVDINGGYIALSGVNRITHNVELTGKLGAFHYEIESIAAGRLAASDDGTGTLLGIGANFYITPKVAMGVEFTHINDVEDEDINSLWLHLHIRPGT